MRPGKKTKLTEQDVAEIKYLLNIGSTYKEICDVYFCNPGTISRIKHGKSFKDIKPVGMNLVDTIFCSTEVFAEEMFTYYTKKGYSVSVSTVGITTGTHGDIVVKRLDILEK